MAYSGTTQKERALASLSGVAGTPIFLPDFSLLTDRDSLEIAAEFGVPGWSPVKPWTLEYGVPIEKLETAKERKIQWQTATNTLTAGWTLGPDNDWWQTEYPVKDEKDLAALSEIIDSITFTVSKEELPNRIAAVGEKGLVVAELPMRPYSYLLHYFLGWTDGLMLAMMNENLISGLRDALENKLRPLSEALAQTPAEVFLYPDNLDAQFIPPPTFEEHLAHSYSLANEIFHSAAKKTVVHVGGMVKPILRLLASTSVDVIEGICGSPQSDADFAEAREIAGGSTVLWGGIAQDFVLHTHDQEKFEAEVKRVLPMARSIPRVILGIADRVPVGVLLARLAFISRQMEDG